MNKTFIIVSGGHIDKEVALKVFEEENRCIIGVDKGIEFLYYNKISPDYILGDFDSADPKITEYYREETRIPIKELNPVKDASDTEVAIKFSMTIGAKEIVIIGATGGRIDHLWANIQSLVVPMKKGVKATIVDNQNRISVYDDDFDLKKEDAFGDFFSIFSLDGDIHGLTIKGAKYPLNNHTLAPHDSLSVSNSYAADEVKVSFNNGTIVLMETKDL
ncbi:MAG: thiamine diphosphokinase [Suipraeoptans sp.]